MQPITLGTTLGLTAPIALALAAHGQDESTVLPAPRTAAVSAQDDSEVMTAEFVTELGPWVVETMEEVMLRETMYDSARLTNRRLRNDRQGTWEVPGPRRTFTPHSGEHYVVNAWGDTRMGIGFNQVVDVDGAWFIGQGPLGGAWARGVQVVGYRDGQVVGTTEWFLDIDDAPSRFVMDLAGVDRIEIVAAPHSGAGGGGWFGMDDLSFTEVESGRRILIDFEDTAYEDSLTGSGYMGLTWETGTGEFTDDVITVPPPRTQDGGYGPMGGGPPGNPAGAGGLAAPQVGNGTLPILVQNFQGPKLGDPGGGAVPPDTHGSVGIDHFMTTVNLNVSIYEKATGNRVMNTGLGSFFSTGGIGDPRVIFDPDSQRWIACATNFGSRIYIGVSATSDPTGAWFKTFWNATTGTDSGKSVDYPTLGVDKRWVVISAAMFGASVTHTIFAIDKAPLIGSPQSLGTIAAFRGLTYERALQPCVHWEDAGEAYVASTNISTRHRIRTIHPPVASPTLTTAFVNLSTSWTPPPSVPVLGSSNLDALDGRLIMAVYRLGSVWTANSVKTGARASSRWYEMDPVSNTEVQFGTVRDNIDFELHYFNPSICPNSEGHVVLGGTASSANQYAGAFYTGRLASDPPGEMAQPFEYKPGAGVYNQQGGVQRWGDYSMTSADPVDDTVWTIQEFARAGNAWGNNIAQLDFESDCPTVYCDTNADNAADITADSCDCSSSSILVSMSGAPAGQFGYLLVGAGNSTITDPPGAQGDLCLIGASIGRYTADAGVTDGSGNFSTDILNAVTGGGGGNLPDPPGGNACSPGGQTWNFQFWHRDGMNPSKFSKALTITFN